MIIIGHAFFSSVGPKHYISVDLFHQKEEVFSTSLISFSISLGSSPGFSKVKE